MNEGKTARIVLGIWTVAILLFLFVPIGIICLYAFNESNVQSWPIPGFSTKWISPALHNQDMQEALLLSLKAAAPAGRCGAWSCRWRCRASWRARSSPSR